MDIFSPVSHLYSKSWVEKKKWEKDKRIWKGIKNDVKIPKSGCVRIELNSWLSPSLSSACTLYAELRSSYNGRRGVYLCPLHVDLDCVMRVVQRALTGQGAADSCKVVTGRGLLSRTSAVTVQRLHSDQHRGPRSMSALQRGSKSHTRRLRRATPTGLRAVGPGDRGLHPVSFGAVRYTVLLCQ